jgi:hydroxyacylglutathione hydrolase
VAAPGARPDPGLGGEEVSIDVQMLTVGAIAENCFLLRREGSDRLLIVDPGDEAERILETVEQTGAKVEAILVTHCHFDHIGAVAPVAAATGAPVYCPRIEAPILADIMTFVPYPGFGPFESYDADELVGGGETLELAGLTLDVIFTPGHSPGHVTYSVRDEDAIFSGDVLFQGSVGRVDLPGGDGPALLRSINTLLESHSPETGVYPGHMGVTMLAVERSTNPFLVELAG